MIALLIILYIIIAVIVIMSYIFYKTRVKHTKVYLYSEEDGWIFMGGLFWPLFGALSIVWLICHLIYTFFDWFANNLQDEEEE